MLSSLTVDRMVKYTGYGNAAGLLANRGLMLGGRGDGDYPSDSEDSETEEYSQLKEQYVPFLACKPWLIKKIKQSKSRIVKVNRNPIKW